MIGIVYKAVDKKTNEIVKIGSTAKGLKFRSGDKYYENCVLIPIRTDEYEDSDFGTLCLRVRELLEISKNHTWYDEGGKNIANPVGVWISHLDDFEMRSYAGKKGGTKTFQLYGNPGTKEGCTKAGTAGGKKNVETGWASELGKRYGAARGKIEVENGHLASLRTKEHQSAAGKKGGLARQEVKDGWAEKMGRVYGPANGKNIPMEARKRGSALAIHNRWHVKRNKTSDSCMHCSREI